MERFIAEAIHLRALGEVENYDHLFTPEVLAQLDEAAREVDAGRSFSGHQVDAYLAENKKEWLEGRRS